MYSNISIFSPPLTNRVISVFTITTFVYFFIMHVAFSSDTALYNTIHRACSILSPCLTGLCVCMCVCTCVTLSACWSSLAQSVIQVRPTGSGLMRIGSALFGSWPAVEGVCGAQGGKRSNVRNTNCPSWERACDVAKLSENSDLSRHNGTAQCFGFHWGAVGRGFPKDTQTAKVIRTQIQGVQVAAPFLFVCLFFSLQKAVLFLFPAILKSYQGSCPWQTCFKVMLMYPSLFKLW